MRRWRSLGTASATALALTLGPWAVVGFAGLTTYPHLLRALTSREEPLSYSLSGALESSGLSTTPAELVAVAVALALVAVSVRFARTGDDARSFVAAILASLAVTPILWQHYLVLLLVAVGVMRPWFGPLWLLPMLVWLAPRNGNGSTTQTLLVPLVVAAIGACCLLGRPSIANPNAEPASA